eukprot:505010_1
MNKDNDKKIELFHYKCCHYCEMVACPECDVFHTVFGKEFCANCYDEIISEKWIAWKCEFCCNFIPAPSSENECDFDQFLESLLDEHQELGIVKCERDKCDQYVCLNCNTKRQSVIEMTECSTCGDIDVLYLCESHEWNQNDWKCNNCYQ